jgi:hypothetical protein
MPDAPPSIPIFFFISSFPTLLVRSLLAKRILHYLNCAKKFKFERDLPFPFFSPVPLVFYSDKIRYYEIIAYLEAL